jgi:F0F1-type ATP synthase membrane subunit c/vacuolar-type H+-ATPase subunit K
VSVTQETGDPETRLRVLRIVVVALCVGVLTALGILTWMRSRQPPPPPFPGQPLLSWIGLAFAVLAVVGSQVVPGMLARSGRQRIARELAASGSTATLSVPGEAVRDPRWWGLYQTKMIVGCALLEGAAFYQAIAFLLEGEQWTAALAVALLVGIALHFPTRPGVEQWIEAQAEQARSEATEDL